MEMMNAPGMGYAATRIVGVLFDRLVTRSVISYAEANAILDDAIALIEGRGETVSTSDALQIIEALRGELAKHDVR
jgi:hypothetical protein